METSKTRRESKFASPKPPRTESPRFGLSRSGGFSLAPALLFVVWLASVGLWAPVTFADEETCASCGQDVSLSGDFAHRKDAATIPIEGAANNAAAFHEEIYGNNFIVSVAHLPAGKYTIVIGEADAALNEPGARLFDVTCGDAALATNFDIVAVAGGPRKVCYITGAIEHEDDSIKGPLTVSFQAVKNFAKFNTFEIRDASGAAVVAFNASEMAEPFDAAATRVPEISDPPIWRDPSQPLEARENDLIRRMSLAEKVAQLQNGAPGNSAAWASGI